ncbi:glycoside hydrolase family 3 protein [Streptomyces parvulus]|uniref:Glycoside hydrolase family 3 N-terminal domain-containing protein n=1 Tax=Streptomyces parvulus TaxID=146923 RepID=A0A191V365_9ACTN|nr:MULTISPECIES: glycoside hydrolase family 3 N-terminal domain-containing protein [Streptomyces]ANJ09434.1 sugar hydrolase [Streptomyces parvulus]MCC9154331.1 glycoside hydrolase family 3 protein [Streptomyces parvulus]MCE7686225.1 glycoside hydrolase family 3 protein [Streptomyces parvulus]MCQ4191868.1 glycoside hydrolase family 3 protein [Streptomyces parvulus]MZD55230.1 glycoside hydrolase family 3 protein [Streptomyces sp. SID5606]
MTTIASGTDTLTQNALTVLQPGFSGTTAPDWLLRRLGEGLASVALFGRNVSTPEQVAALTAQLRAEREDVLVAIDEEGGDVTRLEVRTGSSFPGNHALGAVDDVGLTRAVAAELGRRLADCGVNFNWAPSADVNSNPDNPVIGVRSFGASTDLVARHTAAYVTGMQSAGVATCTKHFPGHGDTGIDSHHAVPRIDVDASVLAERDLVPFRAAIAAGSRAVMSAHILAPALDPDRPATLSRRILTDLLRGELGYEGLIVTDGIEMRAISGTYGIERGSALAIAAGADAICVGGGLCDEDTVRRLSDALVDAVRSGELPEERLADAADRVRALSRWTAANRPDARTAGAPDEEVGLRAARRALRVTATEGFGPVTEPPFVAAFTPVANIAVGDETPWGVAAELRRLLPGTETGSFTGPDAGQGALAAAGTRRIVAVVRDEHRHPWMAAALDTLLAARPDTVVVEMGVPRAEPRGSLHLATYGAARVCGRAAAEAVAGA